MAYELFNIDGSNISWEHKTFEYDPARAFYAWDMNGVKDYFKNNEEMRAFLTMYPECTDYSDLPDNYIYVNLWAWDQDGKLKITENGKGTSRGDGQGGKSSVHVVLHGAHDCLEQRMEQQGLSQSAQVHAFPRKSLYSPTRR